MSKIIRSPYSFGSQAPRGFPAINWSHWQSTKLVACWPLVGESQGLDISGFGNHAVVAETGNDIRYTPSTQGQLVAEFDTGKSYEANGFILDATLPFSISFSYRLDAYTDTFPGPLNFLTNAGQRFTCFFTTSSGNEPFSFGSSTVFEGIRINPTVHPFQDTDLGETHHMMITWDDNTSLATIGDYKCYRDGLNQTLATVSVGSPDSATRIGKASVSSTQFDGQIWDVRVNNVAFTPGEAWQIGGNPFTKWGLYLEQKRKRYSFDVTPGAAATISDYRFRQRFYG